MTAPRTIVNGAVKACCRDEANLEIIEEKPHVRVKRCRVCGCRHFRAFMSESRNVPNVPITGTPTRE